MSASMHFFINFIVGLVIGFFVAYVCDEMYPDIPVHKNWRYWVGGFAAVGIYLWATA